MANQELRVGDIVRDIALITQGMRVTWSDAPPAAGFVVGRLWEPEIARELVERVGVRILALPAPAAETPLGPPPPCINAACRLPERHHGLCDDLPAPPPPPPRCAPGCSPARACYTPSVCPAFEERRLACYNYGHGNDDTDVPKGVPSDIPPAREPRIGALSWGYAAVCGGLSTRRGR